MKYSSSQVHFILKELLLSFIIFGVIYLLFNPIFELNEFIFIAILLSISPFFKNSIFYYFLGVREIVVEKESIQLLDRHYQKYTYHKNEIEFLIKTSFGLKLRTQSITYLFYKKSFINREWTQIEQWFTDVKESPIVLNNNSDCFIFKPKYTKGFYIAPIGFILTTLSLFLISGNIGSNNFVEFIILFILSLLLILFYSYNFPKEISLSYNNLYTHRFIFPDKIINYDKIYDITEQIILTDSGRIKMTPMENGYILAKQLTYKLQELGLYKKNIKNKQVVKEKIQVQAFSITMIVAIVCFFLMILFKFFVPEGYLVLGFFALYGIVFFIVKLRLKFKT